jgi:hypothetical protein
VSRAVHRRYHDRPDLAVLAKCNNIDGRPICPPERLTSDDAKVTCKRCLRIIDGNLSPNRTRPYSDADYRLFARLAHPPKRVTS